jgi:hypothetical protein
MGRESIKREITRERREEQMNHRDMTTVRGHKDFKEPTKTERNHKDSERPQRPQRDHKDSKETTTKTQK